MRVLAVCNVPFDFMPQAMKRPSETTVLKCLRSNPLLCRKPLHRVVLKGKIGGRFKFQAATFCVPGSHVKRPQQICVCFNRQIHLLSIECDYSNESVNHNHLLLGLTAMGRSYPPKPSWTSPPTSVKVRTTAGHGRMMVCDR